jgi:hypothetical protein
VGHLRCSNLPGLASTGSPPSRRPPPARWPKRCIPRRFRCESHCTTIRREQRPQGEIWDGKGASRGPCIHSSGTSSNPAWHRSSRCAALAWLEAAEVAGASLTQSQMQSRDATSGPWRTCGRRRYSTILGLRGFHKTRCTHPCACHPKFHRAAGILAVCLDRQNETATSPREK